MANEMLSAALEYAEKYGIAVHPLQTKSKRPATPHGFQDATTDVETIREAWTEHPTLNIGGAMGEASGGVVCIDIDVDESGAYDGNDALDEWQHEHGQLPETATAVTGRGGTHLFYRVDREIPKCENAELHIDIRGDGSYAMLAPSVHPNGNAVYWDLDPDDVGITNADENVYAFIDHVRPAATEGETFELPQEGVPQGERDNTIYRFCCSMWAKNTPREVIAAAAHAYNEKYCHPPLSRAEVEKKVASATRHKPGLSSEFEQSISKKDEKPTKVSQHVTISRVLLDKWSACFLDGAPAVFDGLSYQVGWDAVERAVLQEWTNSRDRDRKEVVKYLALTMPHETQSDARYIGFTNGVLDIETMELLSFSPKFRIPNVIPHDWNPKAHSDVLNATLLKISCGDPFIEANLCEFMGLCMFRSGKYAFSAILLGRQEQTASNGKSTYIDLIRSILGEKNYSSLSWHALGERFNQSYLAGKLANLGDDISGDFANAKSVEVYKKAVSGTRIQTDVKGTRGFEFFPYCTVIFSANKFPRMEKLDDGTLRRMWPIRFNAYFTASDDDFDPDIGEKLRDEACIEAAIVRAVAGLRRVIDQRRPTANAESEKLMDDIRVDNSTILQWLEDEFITAEDVVDLETRHVFARYEEWCSASGIRHGFGKREFSRDLCKHLGLRVRVTRRDSKSVRLFEKVD